MNDEPLPMGKKLNCHFGSFELPYEILEVGVFDDHLIVTCKEATYKVRRDEAGKVHLEELEFRG